MKLYRKKLSDISGSEYADALSCLPQNVRERVEKKRNENDRRLSAVGYMLALFGAREHGIFDAEINFESGGKPYFKDAALYFSISHCKECVAVAVSEKPVGVDIEMRRAEPRGVAERFFTGREHELDFFEVWTRKEAFGKCRGGISHAFGVDVSELPFYTEDDGEYVIAVYEE